MAVISLSDYLGISKTAPSRSARIVSFHSPLLVKAKLFYENFQSSIA